MTPEPLYKVLASTIIARDNCARSKNTEWQERHQDRIDALVLRYLPSGSGFDSGTRLDQARGNGDSLTFYVDYHHMNENGCYDGWTTHRVTVHPSLAFGFRLTIGGRNRNEIKDYIADIFSAALLTPVDPFGEAAKEVGA